MGTMGTRPCNGGITKREYTPCLSPSILLSAFLSLASNVLGAPLLWLLQLELRILLCSPCRKALLPCLALLPVVRAGQLAGSPELPEQQHAC